MGLPAFRNSPVHICLKLSAVRGTTSAKSCEHTSGRCHGALRSCALTQVRRKRWCSRAGVIDHGRGSQPTSILIRPALCPPIEMSKKTTGLPPAAPGIEPIPDMAQARPGKNRAEGVQVSRALLEHTRGGSEGGGKVTRVAPACGVSGQPAGGAWWSAQSVRAHAPPRRRRARARARREAGICSGHPVVQKRS